MRKLLVITLIPIFLIPLISTAFNVSNAELGSIKGVVYDEQTKLPLEYATVSIFKNDSLIDGSITNSEGLFTIKGINSGEYKVEISFIGYESICLKQINIQKSDRRIDLGKIYLTAKAQELGEVVVKSDASLVSYKIDRKVIQVKNMDINESGTAIDVLENYPSINVEIDGSVSLRGSTSFKVLLNDRPTILDPSTVLN